jgi:hypothetical protein
MESRYGIDAGDTMIDEMIEGKELKNRLSSEKGPLQYSKSSSDSAPPDSAAHRTIIKVHLLAVTC